MMPRGVDGCDDFTAACFSIRLVLRGEDLTTCGMGCMRCRGTIIPYESSQEGEPLLMKNELIEAQGPTGSRLV